MSKIKLSRFLLCLTGGALLLVLALTLGLLVPIPDNAGRLELSTIRVNTDWRDLPLPEAIAELNDQISDHNDIRSRVCLGPNVDPNKAPKVTLQLENIPVTGVCMIYG